MNDTYTINVGRNDFRRWVLVIKDNKVIDRALASNKYRVKPVIKALEKKYAGVEGTSLGVCYLDEFDCNTNTLKAVV